MFNCFEPHTHLQLYDRTGYFNSILSSSFLSAVDPSCKATDLKIICQLEEGRKLQWKFMLGEFDVLFYLQVWMFHSRSSLQSSAASQTSSSTWWRRAGRSQSWCCQRWKSRQSSDFWNFSTMECELEWSSLTALSYLTLYLPGVISPRSTTDSSCSGSSVCWRWKTL